MAEPREPREPSLRPVRPVHGSPSRRRRAGLPPPSPGPSEAEPTTAAAGIAGLQQTLAVLVARQLELDATAESLSERLDAVASRLAALAPPFDLDVLARLIAEQVADLVVAGIADRIAELVSPQVAAAAAGGRVAAKDVARPTRGRSSQTSDAG